MSLRFGVSGDGETFLAEGCGFAIGITVRGRDCCSEDLLVLHLHETAVSAELLLSVTPVNSSNDSVQQLLKSRSELFWNDLLVGETRRSPEQHDN